MNFPNPTHPRHCQGSRAVQEMYPDACRRRHRPSGRHRHRPSPCSGFRVYQDSSSVAALRPFHSPQSRPRGPRPDCWTWVTSGPSADGRLRLPRQGGRIEIVMTTTRAASSRTGTLASRRGSGRKRLRARRARSVIRWAAAVGVVAHRLLGRGMMRSVRCAAKEEESGLVRCPRVWA